MNLYAYPARCGDFEQKSSAIFAQQSAAFARMGRIPWAQNRWLILFILVLPVLSRLVRPSIVVHVCVTSSVPFEGVKGNPQLWIVRVDRHDPRRDS